MRITKDGIERVTRNFATRIAEDGSNSSLTYMAKAEMGAANASAVWQIFLLDTTVGTVITWADGNDNFDNIWDNRESLSYS